MATRLDVATLTDPNEGARHEQYSGASETAIGNPGAQTVGMKLEVVVIPVSDVDRAKRFYGDLGWRLDADFVTRESFASTFTPPGSPCSSSPASDITAAAPGSAEASTRRVRHRGGPRRAPSNRGVDVSEVFHHAGVCTFPKNSCRPGQLRLNGPDAERRRYASYAYVQRPDGNGWLLQEVTARLPGRVDADNTTFTSSMNSRARSDVRRPLMRGTKSGPVSETEWPDWYAEYIVRPQAGKPPPT